MLDYIKPNLAEQSTDNDMYAWHAHLIKRNKKILLVLMHDLSRFTLVFYGVKKSDLKELYQTVSIAMANSMIDVGFTPDEINAFLDKQSEALKFGKTKSRTLVARLNKAVEMTDHVLSTDGYYKDAIIVVNKVFEDKIIKVLSFSAGDSVQGLFDSISSAYEAFLLIKNAVYPHVIRAGIGYGTINQIMLEKFNDLDSNRYDGQDYHRVKVLQRTPCTQKVSIS